MVSSYGPDLATGGVVYFLLWVILLTPLHSDDFFTWAAAVPTSPPPMVLALPICLLERGGTVIIGLSFCIMSFLLWICFEFHIKVGPSFPLCEVIQDPHFAWSTFNIFPSITLECNELVLIFLSAVNLEPKHEAVSLSRALPLPARAWIGPFTSWFFWVLSSKNVRVL